MKPSIETEALVVGGGPVGMTAGLSLAARGVRTEIVDKDWAGAAHSYALALHSGSLTRLQQLGLARDLIEQGHRVETVGFYDGTRQFAEIRLAELGGSFPFVLVLPQSQLENALEQRLKKAGVPLLWNHQAMSIDAGEDSVEAEIGRVDKVSMGYPVARTEWVVQKRYRTRCSFLVGADGYHSLTRSAIGARYQDLGGARTFAVFEFDSPLDLGHELRVVFSNGTTNVLWPLKNMRGRWSFQLEPGTRQPLTDETLQSLIRSRAPWFESTPGEIYWSTLVHFERRLVDRFGGGRVWLAGDAAHITGPAGVQSMNVGMAEAIQLGERIAAVCREGAALDSLADYERGCSQEWKRLLAVDARFQLAPDAAPQVKEHAAGIVSCVPASGGDLDRLLAQIGLQLG